MRRTRNAALRTVFVLGLVLFGGKIASAQQTFSATVYFDYASYLSKEGPITSDAKNNYFAFRRAYFTYENKINDKLKFRFRLDADNTANVTGVTLTPPAGVSTAKDDKLRPFMKHLYLEYADFIVPKLVLNVGMIETLTFKPAEDRWGLRSVAKTLLDGYKDITKKEIYASSADIGVTLKYSASKYLRGAAGYYNGAAYTHPENDKYKEVELQAAFLPVAGFSIVGYYDFESKLPVASLPAETHPKGRTYKLDAFFEMVKNLVVGAEWFTYQNDLYQVKGEKYDVGGWSVFGRYALQPDKLAVFARYDGYAPNSLDGDQDLGLVIAGLDWAAFGPSCRLQPNVWFYDYKNGTRYNPKATKNSDIVFNLTFFLSF
jgi:hypothetical protein